MHNRLAHTGLQPRVSVAAACKIFRPRKQGQANTAKLNDPRGSKVNPGLELTLRCMSDSTLHLSKSGSKMTRIRIYVLMQFFVNLVKNNHLYYSLYYSLVHTRMISCLKYEIFQTFISKQIFIKHFDNFKSRKLHRTANVNIHFVS